MSSPHWMSLLRRVLLLCGVAIVAVGPASAQSTSSSNTSNTLSASESSSTSNQLVADSGLGDGEALNIAAAALGSGAGSGAAQEEGGGWRHGRFSPSHLAFEAGAGFNAPIGNDTPFITWGGNFTVGAGMHLSNRIATLIEYQFIDDKLPGAFVAAGGGQNGDAHIWSFTVEPVVDLFPKRANSIYVTGGGGFYRKVTSFTVDVCCDFYGYLVPEVANHFSSNQGGLNAGLGISHRLGGVYGDGQTKLFAEARYLFVDTPRFNAFTGPVPVGTTELIPVSFGVRW
jgi:hypothetical protein